MLNLKIYKSTNLILLAACSGALFFNFSTQPADSQLNVIPTVAAKTVNKTQAITKVKVTANQAIKVFTDKYAETDVKSLSLEKKHGKYYYEVEGVGDKKEHELKIDANSKKIINTDTDTLDPVEQKGVKRAEEKIKTKKLLTVKQAVKAAQKKVKSGTVTEVSLDQSLGITYWEVNFKQADKKVEVNIDAQSGKFLSKETSEIDD